ncbi:hypothetical protein [Methylobacterium iners]|uniref:Uncharacterized protein n=1 Tax=Methylobacterium iners TaxID=418707 RepID=A0ABQ4S1V2_9HYPH|nr:hypothetical protein [Methylobacterium iners]GJD96971.1 hypothetical protein OCOJLMKI_4199 [Methylobacterium iners]
MPSPDLKPVMNLRGRRGPSGRLWLEGDRAGRRFAIFETSDGSWRMFERVGHPLLAEPEEPKGARSNAPPPRPARKSPRRVRRELAGLGLLNADDDVREVSR